LREMTYGLLIIGPATIVSDAIRMSRKSLERRCPYNRGLSMAQ
jgi:hypothetical protein